MLGLTVRLGPEVYEARAADDDKQQTAKKGCFGVCCNPEAQSVVETVDLAVCT